MSIDHCVVRFYPNVSILFRQIVFKLLTSEKSKYNIHLLITDSYIIIFYYIKIYFYFNYILTATNTDCRFNDHYSPLFEWRDRRYSSHQYKMLSYLIIGSVFHTQTLFFLRCRNKKHFWVFLPRIQNGSVVAKVQEVLRWSSTLPATPPQTQNGAKFSSCQRLRGGLK